MSEPASTIEHRRATRRPALTSARLLYDQRRATVDCTVRNVSATGLLVRVPESVTLPDLVEIELPGGGAPRPARFRWRRPGSGGLEFVEAETDDRDDTMDGLRRRIAALEKENLRLKAHISERENASY